MILGKGTQHFRHAHRYPAIAPSPKERHIVGVIEESVRLLQLAQICHHLVGIAIEILAVVRGAIGLKLQNRQHEHVVDPESRFARKPIRPRVCPLAVREMQPHVASGVILGFDRDLQRHHSEDLKVHVLLVGNQIVKLGREQWPIACLQLRLEGGIVRRLCILQRAIPCAHFGINDRAQVRALEEVHGHTVADVVRVGILRPILKILLLRKRNG